MTHFREGLFLEECEEPSDALHNQSLQWWLSTNTAGNHPSRPAASLYDSSLCDPRQHGLFTIEEEEEEEQAARNGSDSLQQPFLDPNADFVSGEEDQWANVPLGVAVELAGLEEEHPMGTENSDAPALAPVIQEDPEQGEESGRAGEAAPAEQDSSPSPASSLSGEEEGLIYLNVTIVKDTPRRLLHSQPDSVYSEAAMLASGDWCLLRCDDFERIFGRQKHRRVLYVCPEGDVVYDRKAREVAFRTAAARAEAERDVKSGRRSAPRRYARRRHLEPLWSRQERYVREHGPQPIGKLCDWRRSRVADPGNRGPSLVLTDPAGETWCLVPPEWDEAPVPGVEVEDKVEVSVPEAFC